MYVTNAPQRQNLEARDGPAFSEKLKSKGLLVGSGAAFDDCCKGIDDAVDHLHSLFKGFDDWQSSQRRAQEGVTDRCVLG